MAKNTSFGFLAKSNRTGLWIPVLIGAALWIGAYFCSTAPEWKDLSDTFPCKLFGFSFSLGKTQAYFLGFLCTLIIAYLLVYLNEKMNVIHTRTILPSFFFILLSGTNIHSMAFSTGHICALILLPALYSFFFIQGGKGVGSAFNIGFLLALSALLLFKTIVFLPLFIVGFGRFKNLNARSFLALIFGFLSVIWLIFGYAYLTDKTQMLLLYVEQSVSGDILNNFSLPVWIYLSVICLGALLAIVGIISRMHSEKVIANRMLEFISVLFIICMALIFLLPNAGEEIFILSSIFTALLYSHYFSFHTRLFGQILFWLLVAVSLTFYLFSIF